MSRTSSRQNNQIRIAIIGAVAIIVGAIISIVPSMMSNFRGTTPTAQFQYQVRVQSSTDSANISNARVTIEVGGITPIDVFTDNNGFTQIQIDSGRANSSARIVVEAPGFNRFTQNITLRPNELPDVILLQPTS